MNLISHRGYEDGENTLLENHPTQIKKLLEMGINVEIDVWYIDGKYFLGHEGPKYQVEESFLKLDGLWCHAKNEQALEQMLACEAHCFWHQGDDYTITSKGQIWAYPGKKTSGKNTVFLFPERYPHIDEQKYDYICTDYVIKYLKN